MKLQTPNGDFDLPVNFQIELTFFSQMLNDSGSQSAPLTLPPTPKNLLLVNFSNRLDACFKPVEKMDVVVSSGLFCMQSTLVIHSVNSADGISCTLYLNKGSFAAQTEGAMLSGLSLDVLQHPSYDSVDEAARVQYLIDTLKQVSANPAGSLPFAVFPVATAETMKEETTDREGVTAFRERPFVLNGYTGTHILNETTGEVTLSALEGETARRFSIDEAAIDAAPGFGLTAFLRLKYVLIRLFEKYGYQLHDTAFFDLIDNDEKSIVILNAVADAVYAGKLRYAQLLPAVDIKEFLRHIETLFAGKFRIDELTRTVSFCPYTAWLEGDRHEADSYLASPLKLTGFEFKRTDIRDTSDVRFREIPGTEYIEISSKENSGSELSFRITNGDETWRQRYITATLNIPAVDQILRLNSDIEVEGKLLDEKDMSDKTLLQLAEVRKTGTRQVYAPVFNRDNTPAGAVWVHYPAAFMFPNLTAMSSIRAAYAPYFRFLAKSNMAVEAEGCIPLATLLNMDLEKIPVIRSVPFFVEKIQFALPFNGRQQLFLRTMKEYAER